MLNLLVPPEGKFQFELTEMDATFIEKLLNKDSVVVSNDAQGKVTFPEIEYSLSDLDKQEDGTLSKDFHYTIKEVIPSGATAENNYTFEGYTYDPTVHNITVTVTDNGSGELVITARDDIGSGSAVDMTGVDEDGTNVFTVNPYFANRYKAETSTQFYATKSLTGANLTAGMFTFQLKEKVNGSYVVIDTKTNDAKGKVTFDTITYKYDPAGTPSSNDLGKHEYTISEVIPIDDEGNVENPKNGITYDTTVVDVVTVVTDNGDGTLSIAYGEGEDAPTEFIGPNFANEYDAKGKTTLEGTKTLKGKKLEDGKYKFKITAEGNAPLRDEAGKDYIPTQLTVSNKDGKFIFPELWFQLDDLENVVGKTLKSKTFKYKVTEVLPENVDRDKLKVVGDRGYDETTGIIYDLSEKTVKLTVSDNGDGTLKIEKAEGTDELSFVNENRFTELMLTKSIDELVARDTKGELVNVTAVFRIKYHDSFLNKNIDRTVSVQFDPTKVAAETVTVDKIPTDLDTEDITIEEVYSADYKGKLVKALSKTVDETTGIATFSVEYTNERGNDITGSGVINTVDKNTFGIKSRRDSTGKNPSPAPAADESPR